MENEYKFKLIIVPESYDYGEEEIVYRIYFDEQLISERSLPVLNSNQAITENFNLLVKDSNNTKFFIIQNVKNKKAMIEKIYVNDLNFNKINRIRLQGLDIIMQYINNIEEISNEL